MCQHIVWVVDGWLFGKFTANGWLYEMCGFKSGILSRYMNVNVGDELTIMANGCVYDQFGI